VSASAFGRILRWLFLALFVHGGYQYWPQVVAVLLSKSNMMQSGLKSGRANKRLDISYFFVPTDRGYSCLTRPILSALPHLGAACHAKGDNPVTNRLNTSYKGSFEVTLKLAWILLTSLVMENSWQVYGNAYSRRGNGFHFLLRTDDA